MEQMTTDRSVAIRRIRPIRGFSLIPVVALLLTSYGSLLAASEPPSNPSPAEQSPYFDRSTVPLTHDGPGRDRAAPAGLAEVRIGYFGPDDPDDPDAGDLWCAAQMAIEESNREGGFHGKPFRLVARWSDDPWRGGAAQVTKLVYEDQVWAILGGVDGPSTHVAVQVATKAWLPILCASTTDRTSNSAIVPWVFCLLPGDQLVAPALAAELARRPENASFVVLASDDHDSRCLLKELEHSFRDHQIMPQYRLLFRSKETSFQPVVRRTVEAEPATILLIAGPLDSARMVVALRSAGYNGQLIGGPSIGRRQFLDEARDAAERVQFPQLLTLRRNGEPFAREYHNRFRRKPDFASAATYDAARMLIAAIRQAGLNRVRIHDAVRELSPWDGVAGTVTWDLLGGNTRTVEWGTIHQGQIREVANGD